MIREGIRPAFLLLPLALATGCGGATHATGPGHTDAVTALYDNSPTRSDFFALPWPADDRIVAGGDGKQHFDLAGYHFPGGGIGGYLALFHSEPAAGFGTSAAIFFRFDGPIDPATLPATSADSLAPASGVFLVDVTSASPTHGKRVPVRVRFKHDYDAYIGTDSLALLPEPGFPLRERTRYAAVVTDAVKGAGGRPVKRDARFRLPPGDLPFGVDASHVVVATLYTTADVTSIMRDLRDAVYAQAPVPQVADFRYVQNGGPYDWYQGTYQAPNFQEGDSPYSLSGGRIHLGTDGKPLAARTETMGFALTVPHGEMPKAGWPIVLYAHGTGGSFTSFIDDGSAADAAEVWGADGNVIAKMAMISIDQVLHGPRDPTGNDPQLTFYNFQNLLSARDSIKQGALDDFSLLRLVENLAIDAAPVTRAPIKLDRDRIYFKGHSQGGTTGSLFLPFEPKVKAAVLSGAGAMLELALLDKTQPINIPSLIEAIVGEPIDEYHPLLNLMQTFLESADPHNYARYLFREPPAGLAPKSIYQSLGIVDHYTPIPTIKALALAMGVQPAAPRLQPIDVLSPMTETWATPPLMNNVANGLATGVICEYQVPTYFDGHQAYDGHYVVFNHPDAVRQSNSFLATHAKTGTAQLVP